MAIKAGEYVQNHSVAELKQAAEQALGGQRTFRWAVGFPEVIIDRGGLDAFVCNPPFMGGQKITAISGEPLSRICGRIIWRKDNAAAPTCPAALLLARQGCCTTAAQPRVPRHEHDRPGRYSRGRAGSTDGGWLCHPQGRSKSSLAGRGEPRSRPRLGSTRTAGSHRLSSMRNPRPESRPFLTEPGMITGKPYPAQGQRGKILHRFVRTGRWA